MKDHYIPCLLLSRFSIDESLGRKALVHQLRSDGPRPARPVAAQDLAHSGDFYEHRNFPNLDAEGMHRKELEASSLLRDLSHGVDPNSRSDAVLSLVVVQACRTKSFRSELQVAGEKVLRKAMDGFATPRGVERVKESLREQLGECRQEDLVKMGLPEDIARLALAVYGPERLRELLAFGATDESLAPIFGQLQQAFEQHAPVKRGVETAQIRGLHRLVGEDLSGHSMRAATWVLLKSASERLVLGDCCVVCVGEAGAIGLPFKFGKDWREVYLPIGRHTALVGLSPSGPVEPSLNFRLLNEASAALSNEYIYASQCTDEELRLASLIGSADPLVAEDQLDDIIDGQL